MKLKQVIKIHGSMIIWILTAASSQAHAHAEANPCETSEYVYRWKDIDQRGKGPFVVPIYDIRSRPKYVAFVGNAAKVSSTNTEVASNQLAARLVVDIEHPLMLHMLQKTLKPADFNAVEDVIQGKRTSHIIHNNPVLGDTMVITRTGQKNCPTSANSDILTAAKSFGYSDGISTRPFTAGVITGDCGTEHIGMLAEAVMMSNKSVDAADFTESMMAGYKYLRRLVQCQSLPRIVLDEDVSLGKFLDVARNKITALYDKELQDLDQQKTESLLQRLIVVPIAKSTLRSNRIHSLAQIDLAQEQLAKGHLPVFAYNATQEELDKHMSS